MSYTPSLSARSSIRSETSLFFGFLRKSSEQRRASKLSVASNKERSPTLNGHIQLNDDPQRMYNGNGDLSYKYNESYNSKSGYNLIPRDSAEAQLLSPRSPTKSANFFNSCSSSTPRVITHRNSNANAFSSSYRPVYVPANRERRAMSTVAKLRSDDVQSLFKTSSHTDIAHKVSDTSFLSVETSGSSPKSSMSMLDEESICSFNSQICKSDT